MSCWQSDSIKPIEYATCMPTLLLCLWYFKSFRQELQYPRRYWIAHSLRWKRGIEYTSDIDEERRLTNIMPFVNQRKTIECLMKKSFFLKVEQFKNRRKHSSFRPVGAHYKWGKFKNFLYAKKFISCADKLELTVNLRHHTLSHLMSRIFFPTGSLKMMSSLW